MRVSWDSPLSTVTGKATPKVVKETGFATVGELLGHYPRSYVDRGRLSDLGELTEGDYLSLVGRIVHCEQKSYQDRRTKRQAYRLEVRVKAEDGVLALTYFDRTSSGSVSGTSSSSSRAKPTVSSICQLFSLPTVR